MELKNLVSVSGKSGLFELIKARQDGLIVSALGDNSKSFISSRKHSFTPLDNIGVYLQSGDTVELSKVFESIKENEDSMPLAQASTDELRDYFRVILPNHDEDKVRVSDMKKILQWYDQLNQMQWFTKSSEEE